MNKLLLLMFGMFLLIPAGFCSGNRSMSDSLIRSATSNEEGNVITLNRQSFIDKVEDFSKNSQVWVYKGDKPCIVDFYATWCGPCSKAAPILESLAAKYKGKVIFYRVNVDEEKELAGLFNVSSIPAFLFCSLKGNPSMANGIGQTDDDTRNMFEQAINTLLNGEPLDRVKQ